MKKVYIKRSVEKNILAGHPWCFSGAIERVEQGIGDGDLCEVYSGSTFLGIGYFNSKSEIRLRILTRKKQPVDGRFFRERLEVLRRLKEQYLTDTDAYRLVFGESDNLPGLVVDAYAGVLVLQIHTLGMEKLKPHVVRALQDVIRPKSILERSDVGVRRQEGLDPGKKEYLYGEEIQEVIITENGLRFNVNVLNGQKTGFFLDQRSNRQTLVRYCSGKRVLNCFSYTGGFSVYAASVASHVCSVDISKPAIEEAKKNFALNGYDIGQHEFLSVDAFDYLKQMPVNTYDLIILDPPSFAKNKGQVKNAIKAYITINSKALEKLPDYGILVSSSCTAHIDELTFIKILNQAAVNTGCQLKVLYSALQPHDHPYNLGFPEGRYLKFFVLQKMPVL